MKKKICVIFIFFTFVFSQELYHENLIKKINKKYGKYTTNRFLLLKQKINELNNKSDIEKLTVINNFFNKVKYASDIKVWNQKDYWATPYEFLIKDKGDSEDFAFAKYFTLVKELNMDSEKFFFTYVKSKNKNVSYMVLTYYETKKSIPFVLDSINYKVLPATNRQDIVPIYSFSSKNMGLNKKENSKFKAKQSLKFRDLLKRIKEEKI